ncbi:hypothetical protein D7030_13745 [Flavobacteriaceae bacterium AU392]|nr:hypothetical protein D1817_04745 [Flavobacteriaceae bacterium]RKM81365.1 hypothetical protein D7030_13745 [Flavobacteriaceae bacterium AU392]
MRKSICYYIIVFITFCIFNTSCIEDIDFDQVDDLSLTPVLVSSLAFFDTPADVFILDPGQSNVTRDTLTNIGIFNDPFVVDELIRAEFLFEITNSINREFQTQVDFLNDDLELQHTFIIDVAASPNNEELITEHIEVFENDTLDALKASTQVFFTLTLIPNPNLPDVDENTLGRLRLRSIGTFFFNIETSE